MANWQSYIKEYQNYLKLERGLSKNTIENYTFDIDKLVLFLTTHKIDATPLTIQEEEIQAFIYQIASQLNARSQTRPMFVCLDIPIVIDVDGNMSFFMIRRVLKGKNILGKDSFMSAPYSLTLKNKLSGLDNLLEEPKLPRMEKSKISAPLNTFLKVIPTNPEIPKS